MSHWVLEAIRAAPPSPFHWAERIALIHATAAGSSLLCNKYVQHERTRGRAPTKGYQLWTKNSSSESGIMPWPPYSALVVEETGNIKARAKSGRPRLVIISPSHQLGSFLIPLYTWKICSFLFPYIYISFFFLLCCPIVGCVCDINKPPKPGQTIFQGGVTGHKRPHELDDGTPQLLTDPGFCSLDNLSLSFTRP